MYTRNYSIAGISFQIISALDEEKMNILFSDPQPHNLYINYNITDTDRKPEETIELIEGEEAFVFSPGYLKISADFTKLIHTTVNRQFSLFGNKGLIQKYLLHILEDRYRRIVFHGCALRNARTKRIVIGLGQSGSGKSVFLSKAVTYGWQIIASEQTILDENMVIYKGNTYDNISPASVPFFKAQLPQAVIMEDKRLIEPLGQKVFVDLKAYATEENTCLANFDDLTVINLDFHGFDKGERRIEDEDYYLRLLQSTSSEKISAPAILGNKLVKFPAYGNPVLRQSILDRLISSTASRIILSGGLEGFDSWFAE